MSKEKVSIDPTYVLVLTAKLAVTCIVVAGLLGLVNNVTAGPIAEINKAKTEAAMVEVVADSSSTFTDALAISDEMIAAASSFNGTISEVYGVQVGGADVGYAVKVVAGGSQGDITLMVGVDMDAAVTGVSVVTHSETSGIGTKVTSNQDGVLSQFEGMSHAVDGVFVMKGNVNAISGATVSSNGVTKGINAAVAAIAAMS